MGGFARLAAAAVMLGASTAANAVRAEAAPQRAMVACSPRDDVLAQLAAKFGELPVGVGLANNGGLLELLATADGATWTIIVTMPNGLSCLAAAAEDWRVVAQPETQGETL